MLTLFTIPKAFHGQTSVIQKNAIMSWLQLRPACQVILLGDDSGTAEIAGELGLLHLSNVQRSRYGTPLVNSMFTLAQQAAEYPLMCYINADIILLDDFLPVVQSVNKKPALIVGQRWDLDVSEQLDFQNKDWQRPLLQQLRQNGKLHGISGMDYFVYSQGVFFDIPRFAVGRTTWDTWLIYRAEKSGAAVIDATEVITAVHQNHDYNHDSGGATNVWKGPEAVTNRSLAGNGRHMLTLEHATYRLTTNGLKRALKPRDIYFRIDAISRLYPWLGFLQGPLKAVMSLKNFLFHGSDVS